MATKHENEYFQSSFFSQAVMSDANDIQVEEGF